MSRTTRLVSAAVLASAAVPLLGVGPAHAATTETGSSGGYFSSTGPQDTGTPAGTPPNLGTQVDGVAAGNLAVAGGSGQEQKVSFLLFPAAGLEPGASVGRAVLTVPLAEGDGNTTVNAAPEKVRACAAGDQGFGGEDGASLLVAPERKCDVFAAPGKASPDGTSYVFDITGLATLWTEANDGVALTVAEGADTTPFQVVFGSADQATLTYDAAAPADDAEAPASSGSSDDGAAAAPSGGSGTADLAGGFDAVVDAPVEPAPLDFGASGDIPLAVALDAPPLEPTTELVDAPVAAAPQVITRAAGQSSVPREQSLTPELGFWLGLGVLGGLLALVSLVLGDPEVRTQTRSSSRLSVALEQRQGGGTPGSGRSGLALG